MNTNAWKPADYRRGTERVGTVIVAVVGLVLAAGAVFLGLMLWALAS